MILKTLRRHWDLIPMVAAVSCGCIGATVYTIYAAVTKTDVRWNKASELPPFERVVPTDKQKFVVVNQEYKAIDELEKLKAEIGPYKG